jgi:hypothetical protein
MGAPQRLQLCESVTDTIDAGQEGNMPLADTYAKS